VSLIYSSPIPAALFWATYLAFILLDARLVTRALAGRAVPGDSPAEYGPIHRPLGIVWLMAGEGVGIGLAAVDVFVLPWRVGLLVIGLALAWAGIGLRYWAKRTLGRFFVGAVVIQEGHHVVRHGPYAVIRHPGYAGSMLALLGLGVATGNVATIVVFVAVAVVIFTRTIRTEETALRAQLGSAYVDYSRGTAKLVPRVW
jgi:protein-S-isoprenylcysteine O-methyltransferase